MEELTDRALDMWLAEHLFELRVCFAPCEWMGDYFYVGTFEPHAHHSLKYPRSWSTWPTPYSSTGGGMLLVLEAMRERGWYVQCHGAPDGVGALFQRFYEQGTEHRAEGASLPRAVAEAAKAALEAHALS